jgi:hypothetical protein
MIDLLKNNAIPWIEVMSLENRLESVIDGIYVLLNWLGTVGRVKGSQYENLIWSF